MTPDFVLIPATSTAPVTTTATQRLLTTVFSRSSQLFRSKVTINPDFSHHSETHQASVALEALLNTDGQFFSSTVIDQYLQVLQEKFPTTFSYSIEGTSHLPDQIRTPLQIATDLHTLVQDKAEITHIAIPYDNKGHHVVIFIDRTQKQVEYYDPNGDKSDSDGAKRGLDFCIKQQIQAIQNLFFKEVICSNIENSTPHQKCVFRCALWGLLYIDRRLKGQDAVSLNSEFAIYTNSDIDTYRRDTVAKQIEQRAYRLLKIALESSSTTVLADETL